MSQLSTVKESKSAATIRRRRHMGILQTGRNKSMDDDIDSGEDPDPDIERVKYGPPTMQLLLCSEKTLFLGLLAFRIVNALIIQTSYVPDEYWQSLEVSHRMAFGYGHLTWEWHQGIRGYTYPAIFATLYKGLEFVHLDNRILLIKLPRIVQAVFAAFGDFFLFKLSWKLTNQKIALWTLFCQLTSWFTFFCATRTLTNSMETVFTTMALYYFPWPGKPRKACWKYLCLVGLAVVMRPTAAILWLPLCIWHIYMQRHAIWGAIKLYAEVGFIIICISSLIDKAFYGKWVNVYYNFLEFNVFSNIGAFYGSHPWHWYLTQGFAVIMGTHLFPFILGVRKSFDKILLAVIAWTVFVYSLLEHKEFRFLFPILPLCMHVCGQYLYTVCESPGEAENGQSQSFSSRRRFVVVFLIITNLPIALYTCLIHQRGTVDVMKHIHDDTYKTDMRLMSVLFLTPCHSTPYYSYLHRNVSMEFLTCEPNLDNEPDYVDEAELFFRDPTKWMVQKYPKLRSTLPTHLVMFNPVHEKLKRFLGKRSYIDCARFFHSHVPEGNVGSHVVVSCQVEWKVMSTMTSEMRSATLEGGNTIDIGENSFHYKGKEIPKKSRQKT